MRQVLSVLAVLGLGTAALALADEVDQWERGFARPAAGVYVKGLEGPLRVVPSADGRVTASFRRSAATRRDLECESMEVAEDSGWLRLVHHTRKAPECRIIQAQETLTLGLPAGLALRVLELEGSLESEVALASLEAHVVEGDISARVTGAAQLRSVEGDVDLDLLGAAAFVDAKEVEGSLRLKRDGG